MTLVIETGSGSGTAQAYASAAAFTTWHTAMYAAAPTGTTAQIEGAILRAVRYLDALNWVGMKSQGRAQALSWPRGWVMDGEGWPVPADTIPVEVIEAQHMLTKVELESPGALSPTITIGKQKTLTALDSLGWTPAVTSASVAAYRAQVTMALDRLKGFISTGGEVRRA